MAKEHRERPTVAKILATLQQQDYPGGVQVDHISVRVLSTGDCAWKMYPMGGEEYIGGVFNIAETTS